MLIVKIMCVCVWCMDGAPQVQACAVLHTIMTLLILPYFLYHWGAVYDVHTPPVAHSCILLDVYVCMLDVCVYATSQVVVDVGRHVCCAMMCVLNDALLLLLFCQLYMRV